jgi:hypothetical protein
MSDVTFLIPDLRVQLGDLTEPYRFSDDTIETALFTAIKILGRRWRYRYLIDEDDTVTRNSSINFETTSPTIEFADQGIIVLQAAIILKSSSAWESTWDIGSWRDDEVSYSNIQAAKSRDASIAQAELLLEKALKSRLHPGIVNSMPGFHEPLNIRENR